MKALSSVLIAASGTLISQAAAQVSASFEIIEDSSNGFVSVSANDLSPDGRWIVGGMDMDGNFFADDGYRWDRLTNTFTYLDATPIQSGVDNARAVSDDGQVIAGNIPGAINNTASEAAIWTAADGWTGLGWLPNALDCPSKSDGWDINADGTIVTGLSWDGCSARAYRWTQATGMIELENLANGNCRGSVISADGSTVAGFAQGTFNRTPATWNTNTAVGTLFDPTGDIQGEFMGMRNDGSVILGSAYMGAPDNWFDAIRVDDGVISVVGNGSIIDGWAGNAMDIADNGTVVGFDMLLANRRAWIQPNGEGDLLEAKSYFNSLGANIPADVNLEVITAISSDGKTIIGHGFVSGAWVVTLEYACPADFTGDGELDFLDISQFIADYSNGNLSADLNNDGEYDFLDISAFLKSYVSGCP